MSESLDNVRVVVRVRPLSERELLEGAARKCVTVQQNSSLVLDIKPEPKRFTYDYVADETTTQQELFEVVGKPISNSCLTGYNGTIFAYGQTGAGKTFTIQGPFLDAGRELDASKIELRGLLPRCYEFIFERIEEAKQIGVDFLIRCSYLEIYQEQIMDLLSPDSGNLILREDIKNGVYVEGLIEETVANCEETLELLKIGARNRHVGSTSMNMESSRSHSVFTMLIESRFVQDGLSNFKSSRFHLIDLAGSERQKLTDAAGDRIKEAGMINKSLSALGNVINSLVDISEGRSRHVHYRDSKLTFLLKDSLGGNSKTCIVAAISPAVIYLSETLSTLKFAQRAKLIKNRAVVNEDTTGTIGILKEEVRRLKEEVSRHKEMTMTMTQCPRCLGELTARSVEFGFPDDKNTQLELLLDQNLRLRLETEERLQKEIEQKNAVLESLQTALVRYEKKVSNDKMVLKFRDSTIAKLQASRPLDSNAEIEALKAELQMVRDQLEYNPASAKMFAENEQLRQEIEELRREKGPTFQTRLKENEEFTKQLAEALKETVQEREQARDVLSEISLYRSGEKVSSPIKTKYRDELIQLQTEAEMRYDILQEEFSKLQAEKDSMEVRLTKKLELQALRIEELSIENEQLKADLQNLSAEQHKVDQMMQSSIEFRDIGLSPLKNTTFDVSPSPTKSEQVLESCHSPNEGNSEAYDDFFFMSPEQIKRANGVHHSFILGLSPVPSLEFKDHGIFSKKIARDMHSSPIKTDFVDTHASPIPTPVNAVGVSPSSAAKAEVEHNEKVELAYAEIQKFCSDLEVELAKARAYKERLEDKVEELMRGNEELRSYSTSSEASEVKLKEAQLKVDEQAGHILILENELETVVQTHDTSQSQIRELQKANRELQGQCNLLTHSLKQKEERDKELYDSLEKLQATQEELLEALKIEEEKSAKLVGTLQQCEKQKDQLKTELSELAKKLSKVTANLQDAMRENERLASEIQNTSRSEEGRDSEIKGLKQKLKASRDNASDLTESLSMKERELTRLKVKYTTLQEEAREISYQLSETQATLKAEREKRSQLESIRSEQQGSLSKLQDELVTFKDKVVRTERETAQYSDLEAKLAHKSSQSSKLEQTVNNLEKEVGFLRDEKARLVEANTELTEEQEKLEDKLKKTCEQLDKALLRLEFMSEALMTTRKTGEQQQQANTSLAVKNSELQSEITRLKEEQSKRSFALMEISSESASSIETLKQNLLEAREEIKALKEENKMKMEILQNTNKNIQSTRGEIEMWKKCIDENSQTIADLRKKLQIKTEELASFNGERIQKSMSEDDSELNYLKFVLKLREKELNELKEKGQLYYAQADDAIEFQSKEIDSLNKKLATLQAEANDNQEELRAVTSERDYLVNELKRLDTATRIEDVKQVLIQIRNFRMRLHEREEKLRSKGRTAGNKDDAIYLRAQNQHLSEELKRRIEQIESLHKQLQEAKRTKEGMDDVQVRKQIVKQYDEIKALTEGLTKIADFVFSLPFASFNPEETSIVESTIKGISSIYEALQTKELELKDLSNELQVKNAKLGILEGELLQRRKR
mmetsp:Transcript_571/g.870  ORF Transcript_571/g.870 Transcript_571/m.870 type:complete len:1572 (+) Transcript_571:427-5142(+)